MLYFVFVVDLIFILVLMEERGEKGELHIVWY